MRACATVSRSGSPRPSAPATTPSATAAALDATLATSERSWLVFSHCYGTRRCEPLERRAAGRAELESVEAQTDATLYLARARRGQPASPKASAE